MKALKETQNEYAREVGFDDWNEIEYSHTGDEISHHWDIVSKRFSIEVAKEALSNAYEETKNTLQEFAFKREGVLSKYLSEAIESNKNIPKL